MAKILSFSDYRNYFKSIADQLIALNPDDDPAKTHFYVFPDQFIGNNLKYPALVLIPPKIKPFDKLSDNTMKVMTGELWVLKSIKKGDTAAQIADMDDCEVIMEEIVSKMKSDQLDYAQGSDRAIQVLDLEQSSYEQVSELNGDNAGGYALTFVIANAKQYKINPSLWRS